MVRVGGNMRFRACLPQPKTWLFFGVFNRPSVPRNKAFEVTCGSLLFALACHNSMHNGVCTLLTSDDFVGILFICMLFSLL